ncbi:MAG: hypothetical protein ACO2PN_11480 [Pyrobaculum sp.]
MHVSKLLIFKPEGREGAGRVLSCACSVAVVAVRTREEPFLRMWCDAYAAFSLQIARVAEFVLCGGGMMHLHACYGVASEKQRT